VLPYFKKAEHQERGSSEYHGTDGPLNVADLRLVNPVSRAFVEAGKELGFPVNKDFNGAEQEGFGLYQVTQKNGQRCSTATAYLKPVLNRKNLTVQTGAHVTRLLFENTRAVGVEYVKDGRREQARADKEIILSGGAVNSPQLLMLSGVGPADQLKQMDIPVVIDLQGVGQNLPSVSTCGLRLYKTDNARKCGVSAKRRKLPSLQKRSAHIESCRNGRIHQDRYKPFIARFTVSRGRDLLHQPRLHST